jgi:hypothetical protein
MPSILDTLVTRPDEEQSLLDTIEVRPDTSLLDTIEVQEEVLTPIPDFDAPEEPYVDTKKLLREESLARFQKGQQPLSGISGQMGGVPQAPAEFVYNESELKQKAQAQQAFQDDFDRLRWKFFPSKMAQKEGVEYIDPSNTDEWSEATSPIRGEDLGRDFGPLVDEHFNDYQYLKERETRINNRLAMNLESKQDRGEKLSDIEKDDIDRVYLKRAEDNAQFMMQQAIDYVRMEGAPDIADNLAVRKVAQAADPVIDDLIDLGISVFKPELNQQLALLEDATTQVMESTYGMTEYQELYGKLDTARKIVDIGFGATGLMAAGKAMTLKAGAKRAVKLKTKEITDTIDNIRTMVREGVDTKEVAKYVVGLSDETKRAIRPYLSSVRTYNKRLKEMKAVKKKFYSSNAATKYKLSKQHPELVTVEGRNFVFNKNPKFLGKTLDIGHLDFAKTLPPSATTNWKHGAAYVENALALRHVVDDVVANPVNFKNLGYLLTDVSIPVKKLIDRSAGLMKTKSGRFGLKLLDRAWNRSLDLIGYHQRHQQKVFGALTRADIQWMNGTTDNVNNFRLLMETGMKAPSKTIQHAVDYIEKVVSDLVLRAERSGMQIRMPDGTMRPFMASKDFKLARVYTRQAMQALNKGGGRTFEALADEIVRLNPDSPYYKGLTTQVARRDATMKYLNSLGSNAGVSMTNFEHARIFPNMPTQVQVSYGPRTVNVPIMETNPYTIVNRTIMSVSKRLALMEQFGDDIGSIEQGLDALKTQKNPGLIGSLLETIAKEGGNKDDFIDALNLFEGRPIMRGRLMDPSQPLNRIGRRLFDFAGATQTSSAYKLNLIQPFNSGSVVGYRRILGNYIRGFTKGRRQMSTAEGILYNSYTKRVRQWTLDPNNKIDDFFRNVNQSISTPLHITSEANNTILDEAAREMVEYIRLNGGSRKDIRAIKRLVSLEPSELKALEEGIISADLETKIARDIVAKTQFQTLQPWRKGVLETNPLISTLFPYNQYLIGNFKLISSHMNSINKAVKMGNKAEAAREAGDAMKLLLTLDATGVAGLMIRRAAKGETLVKPEETNFDIARKGFLEVGIFGPIQRIHDAVEYNDGDAQHFAFSMMPKVKSIVDYLTATMGWGSKYDELPKKEAIWRTIKDNVPELKANIELYKSLRYGDTYNIAKDGFRLIHEYKKEHKDIFRKAPSGSKLSPVYYKLKMAFMHGDLDEAQEAYDVFREDYGKHKKLDMDNLTYIQNEEWKNTVLQLKSQFNLPGLVGMSENRFIEMVETLHAEGQDEKVDTVMSMWGQYEQMKSEIFE